MYKDNLDEPLNAQERMLYGINVRLDALVNMFSSFLEVYANEKDIATTSNKVVEEVKEDDIKEETNEVKEETPVRDTVKDVVTEEVDYEELTKAQISAILEDEGKEHNMRMTKDALIELL